MLGGSDDLRKLVRYKRVDKVKKFQQQCKTVLYLNLWTSCSRSGDDLKLFVDEEATDDMAKVSSSRTKRKIWKTMDNCFKYLQTGDCPFLSAITSRFTDRAPNRHVSLFC
ncbi:hypothetical protein PoB_005867300 [Plakobranchus ocellatus]|uniref:Uncharacterized protein n=1 Tax=Plakobranchus ocellatus TaxID=259542 RepID=A0AAV4CJM3_9GAST|nr:hypothetical protein PoB_005867300 [Plakobranchus ocellatus]